MSTRKSGRPLARLGMTMSRPFLLIAATLTAGAATLEYLTLEQMAQKSTAIVRGRVTGATTARQGSMVYTMMQVEVLDRWKGLVPGVVNVAIPGGEAAGIRQTFPGAPKLVEDREYVFFLWAGKSGMNQVIGLSQGLFEVQREGDSVFVFRGASSETILDSAGRPLRDESIRMPLADLKALVRKSVGP